MLKHILTLLCMLLSLFLTSCDNPIATPQQEQDSARTISEFFFLAGNNTSLQKMVRGSILSNEILVTLPSTVEVAEMASLVPTFVVPSTATVTVEGKVQETGVSSQDFTKTVPYVVHAQNGASREYIVTVEIEDSARIRGFSFLTHDNPSLEANVYGSIIGTEIKLTIPFTLNVSSITPLAPRIEHSSGAAILVNEQEQINGESSQSFKTPVTYTVESKDKSRRNYTVTVDFKKNSDAKIYKINSRDVATSPLTAVGEHEFRGIWTLGVSATQLSISNISYSPNASITMNGESYFPNTPIDYFEPIIVKVTSEDKATTNTYIITISSAYKVGDTGPKGGLIFYATGVTVLEAGSVEPNSSLNSLPPVGEGGWRLPTIDELKNLYAVKGDLNSIRSGFLPDGIYWSSTSTLIYIPSLNDYQMGAKTINFANGEEDVRPQEAELHYCPVRDVNEDAPSEARAFISFSLLAADNNGNNLGLDVFGSISYSPKEISVTLPMGVEKQLIPRFTASEGATVLYNNAPLVSGETSIDFSNSNSVPLVVKSERGLTDTYTVNATFPTDYKVGDTGPGGGTIFYKDATGKFGWTYLEAAPSAWSVNGDKPLAWGTSGSIPELASITSTNDFADEIDNGAKNTSAIINQYPSQYYAANFCNAYSGAYKTDWFLPSIQELMQMYKQKDKIDNLINSFYWSSSQRDDNKAWRVSFNTGVSSYENKTSPHLVRPIRRF